MATLDAERADSCCRRGTALTLTERDDLLRLAGEVEKNAEVHAAELMELDIVDDPAAAAEQTAADIWILRESARCGRRLWEERTPPRWGWTPDSAQRTPNH